MITKTCKVSGKEFVIRDDDLKFYEKMEISEPTLCPEERMRRRIAFRNDRSLHKRKCSRTGQDIIALYPENVPFPVYCQESWWREDWSGTDYGKDFDFNRSFFEQFQELFKTVPQLSSVVSKSENCEYNTSCINCQNSYMCQRVAESEDCLFGYLIINCRDCVECYNLDNCELCYEVTDGGGCYNVQFSQNVNNCRDSAFLFNCRNCSNCFGCTNLRNAEFYFLNQKCTQKEYEEKIAPYKNLSSSQCKEMLQSFENQKKNCMVPAMWGNSNENVKGNYIFNCKNTLESYDAIEVEEALYSWGPHGGHHLFDTAFLYHCRWSYDSCGGFNNDEIRHCFNCYDGSNLDYCMHCMNGCSHCFGCVGLKKSKYCILNKQYSKEEYFELKEKIITYMKKIGEWGEYFPIAISPFGYNETVANEYFPLTKERSLQRGYTWRDEEESSYKDNHTYIIPDTIDEVGDDVLDQILFCENTQKPYRIVKPELEFYRKMKLPLPRICPDERHRKRRDSRNPRTLWSRECGSCNTSVKTTYAPSRPEKILCEKCYQSTVN